MTMAAESIGGLIRYFSDIAMYQVSFVIIAGQGRQAVEGGPKRQITYILTYINIYNTIYNIENYILQTYINIYLHTKRIYIFKPSLVNERIINNPQNK